MGCFLRVVGAVGFVGMYSFMPMVAACPVWSEPGHAALRDLSACGEPAVERQLGEVCVRHEWLCGRQAFDQWFAHWMAEIDEQIFMEKRLGQIIFSGQDQDTSWAVFWAPVEQQTEGFVILLSRIRVVPHKEK